MVTWSAGYINFNILIAFTSKLIRDSTVKQGQKGDMKCVQQDGISILEFCSPPCSEGAKTELIWRSTDTMRILKFVPRTLQVSLFDIIAILSFHCRSPP